MYILKAPGVSRSLVTISPFPGVDDSSHEGPGTQHSSVSYNFRGLSSCISPPPPPRAFEVVTGNQQRRQLPPFQESFLSLSVLNTSRPKRDQVYGYIISPQIWVALERRKDRRNHSGTFHCNTTLGIEERVWVNEFNSHTPSSVLCLGSDNANSRRHTTSRSFSPVMDQF